MRTLTFALCICASLTWAGDDAEIERITVTSTRLERETEETPQAVTVIEREDIQSGRQGLQLDEALNRVPGVFAQNRYNFAQNLRVSIRGFGARAPFGIRGIRILVDGIPETLPDGQSQVDAIDLESADRIEVIRGPSSALYGNATGGVLAITTLEFPEEPGSAPLRLRRGERGDAERQRGSMEIRGTIGDHGFRRYGIRGGARAGALEAGFSAWEMDYDGYRDQSATRKRMFNGKLRQRFSDDRSLTAVLTSYDQPKGQDPGGLTRAQARENRRGAAPNAVALDAGQTVRQHRLGMIYEDQALAAGTLRARAFYTVRDFAQQLPFPGDSRIEFDRDFYGAGFDYGSEVILGARPVRYLIGAEIDVQRDDRRRFNTFTGNQVQDEHQQATAAGVFAQGEVELSSRLDLTLASRLDRLRLRVNDRGDGPDRSGSETFDELSASAGLSYRFSPRINGYLSVGSAYETPTFTEFARIDDTGTLTGGFNPDLEPQRAINFEAGIKGQLGERTRYDLAVFQVRTRDEIVNTGTDPNQFENAGRTRRNGLELGLEHFLSEQLRASVAYTFSDFRFRDFADAGGDFHGNRLPGQPRHVFFGEIAWRRSSGVFAIIDGLVVSRTYADNANTESVSGHRLINARAGTTWHLRGVQLEAFIAVNNLMNKAYFSNVRLNQAAGNFFEPGPGRSVVAGAKLAL